MFVLKCELRIFRRDFCVFVLKCELQILFQKALCVLLFCTNIQQLDIFFLWVSPPHPDPPPWPWPLPQPAVLVACMDSPSSQSYIDATGVLSVSPHLWRLKMFHTSELWWIQTIFDSWITCCWKKKRKKKEKKAPERSPTLPQYPWLRLYVGF